MRKTSSTVFDRHLDQGISRALIHLMARSEALEFGSFLLPCGRISPYFVDFARFHTGTALFRLGKLYADKIESSFGRIEFDLVFGCPGYGIPLSTHVAAALGHKRRNAQWAFLQSSGSSQSHAESLCGAKVDGKRVLFVGDVLTVGGSMEEAYSAVVESGGIPIGGVIGFDRMETVDDSGLSARTICSQKLEMPIVSIASFDQLFSDVQSFPADLFVDESGTLLQELAEYRANYGANSNLSPLQ